MKLYVWTDGRMVFSPDGRLSDRETDDIRLALEGVKDAWKRGENRIVAFGLPVEVVPVPDTDEQLARIEAKLDALTHFSGWQTNDGMPLTVAQHDELRRLLHMDEPTDSRGNPRATDAWDPAPHRSGVR